MNDYLKFLEQVVPAVVSIRSVTPQRHPSARVLGTERTGSGAIIDAEGHILTVGYVVMGARTIEITLPDHQQYSASLLFQDFESGMAILQTPARDLPTVRLGRSAALQEGDNVIIVASTDPTQRMASPGFISALRPFDAYWEYMLDRAILTTAMNPGLRWWSAARRLRPDDRGALSQPQLAQGNEPGHSHRPVPWYQGQRVHVRPGGWPSAATMVRDLHRGC